MKIDEIDREVVVGSACFVGRGSAKLSERFLIDFLVVVLGSEDNTKKME